MEYVLQYLLPPLATGILGAIGGGWWMFRRKTGALRAELAGQEFEDVGELVDSYIARLSAMGARIEALHTELLAIKIEVADLKAHNLILEQENTTLRERINDIENGRAG